MWKLANNYLFLQIISNFYLLDLPELVWPWPYFACPESWIAKCGSELIYETLPGNEVVTVRFSHPLHPRETAWFGPMIRGQSRWAIATAVAMAPIATTTILQKLTSGLGTAVQCTLLVPGRWAGPTIRENEMRWVRYHTLLRITTNLLIALIKKEILSLPVM